MNRENFNNVKVEKTYLKMTLNQFQSTYFSIIDETFYHGRTFLTQVHDKS